MMVMMMMMMDKGPAWHCSHWHPERPNQTDSRVFTKHQDLCFTDLIGGILRFVVGAFSKARTYSITHPHRNIFKGK